MDKKANVWTGPHPEGGLANRAEGNKRASSKHTTKTAAVAAGRDRARKDQVERFVQDQKGQIQNAEQLWGGSSEEEGVTVGAGEGWRVRRATLLGALADLQEDQGGDANRQPGPITKTREDAVRNPRPITETRKDAIAQGRSSGPKTFTRKDAVFEVRRPGPKTATRKDAVLEARDPGPATRQRKDAIQEASLD